MKTIEKILINSFKKVKRDIISLRKRVSQIEENQRQILLDAQLSKKEATNQVVSAVSSQSQKKTLIASKNGKLVHKEGCVYLKKINPDNLIFFENFDDAFEEGFEPCKCVKKDTN
jgi:hypothetical protein